MTVLSGFEDIYDHPGGSTHGKAPLPMLLQIFDHNLINRPKFRCAHSMTRTIFPGYWRIQPIPSPPNGFVIPKMWGNHPKSPPS